MCEQTGGFMNLIEMHSDCHEIYGADLDEIERLIAELVDSVNTGNDNDWSFESEYYIKLALSNVLYDKRLMERAIQLLSEQSEYKQLFETGNT
jgi:hypothetical protein